MDESIRKPKYLWVAAVCLVLLIGILGAKPGWHLLQELTFYWFDHTETEYKVKAWAEEAGVFYAEYPKSLIALLERNPETEEFVKNYPFRQTGAGDISGTGREEVPLFLQWDKGWGYEKYGSDFLAVTGCGPTCLAMAGYYLTGEESWNPAAVAEFAEEKGYYAEGYGSSWTLISKGGVELGLTVTELPLVKKKMVDALERGNPVILAMGKGDFTTTGHYIVLAGVEDGLFQVKDPNSIANSGKLWSYEQLEGQIRNIWEIAVE